MQICKDPHRPEVFIGGAYQSPDKQLIKTLAFALNNLARRMRVGQQQNPEEGFNLARSKFYFWATKNKNPIGFEK